jgi:hypothetical protein
MDTKAWGPPLWDSLFFIAYGHSLNTPQDPEKDEHYIRFFEDLANVLPCKYCRESLGQFLKELNPRDYLRDGRGLMRFVYDLKNTVNQKLMKQEFNAANVQYKELLDQYKTGRMGEHQLNIKLRDMSKLFYTKDPPPYQKVFDKYAKHEASCSLKLKTCRKDDNHESDTITYAAIQAGGKSKTTPRKSSRKGGSRRSKRSKRNKSRKSRRSKRHVH